MRGRSTFTPSEIDAICRLLREKVRADRGRQKTLRNQLRSLGFYISDFASDQAGFAEGDLDQLIASGTIGVEAAEAETRRHMASAAARPRADSATTVATAIDGELDAQVRDALAALSRASAHPIAEIADRVPRRAGLYAIHAGADVWTEVGLGEAPDDRPLYVGKAESSLISRDLDTHFSSGRTGSSTVRRSLAALLRDPLGLDAQPRNPAKPERPANYGLGPENEEKLTNWMRERLALVVWPKPDRCTISLSLIESVVLQELLPPLNLSGVVTPWTVQVRSARAVMAEQARRLMEGAVGAARTPETSSN
jgi:hypothetical protein